jgi:hypothetical protein
MSSEAPHRFSADRSPDWLDQIIEKGRERGDFDDLPGHGKPLNLPPESSAPSEFDLAFTMLSNAGFAPWWMELGKEAARLERELAEFRSRAADEIAALRRELATAAEHRHQPASHHSRWRRLFSGFSVASSATYPRHTPQSVEKRRLELRIRHNELAEKLDAKLSTYHAAMPRELWHAQRVRLAPDDWAALFDAACPPGTSAAPERDSSSTPLTNDRE